MSHTRLRRVALCGASALAITLSLSISQAHAQVVINEDVLNALGGGGTAAGVPTYSVYGGLQFPPQQMPRSFSNVSNYAAAQPAAQPAPQPAPEPAAQPEPAPLPSEAAQMASEPEDMSADPNAQPVPEPQPAPEPAAAAEVATPPSPPEPEPAPEPQPAPEPVAEPEPVPEPAPEPEETAVADVATPPSPPEPEPAAEPEPEAAAEPEPEPAAEPETAEEPAEPAPEETQAAALTTGVGDGGLRVVFPEGDSSLPGDAESGLRELAQQMLQDEALRVQLLSYAPGSDSETSRARRLSLSRALEVRGFLIDQGIRSTRMDVRALGNNIPEGSGPADRVDIVPVDR